MGRGTLKTARQAQQRLRSLANEKRAEACLWYFKTGPGEYGHGDRFIGVDMPGVRSLLTPCKDLPLDEIAELLRSAIHEERMLALLLLVKAFKRATPRNQRTIFLLYLRHTEFINNWDLVDASAPRIVGGYLADKPKTLLHRLSRSSSLWERRIAVLATMAFVDKDKFADAFKIARALLTDKHDLIHKAVGWVLREIGKRDQAAAERFLLKHYDRMPRTMLRYAIERFPKKLRRTYLARNARSR